MFFSNFGSGSKKKKKTMLQKLMENDPKLKAIQARIKDIRKKSLDHAKQDTELMDMLKDHGISPDQLK